MARNWFTRWVTSLYQFQLGNDVVQFEARDYDPTFDNKDILGYMKLKYIGGHYYPMIMLRTDPDDSSLEIGFDAYDGFYMSDGDLLDSDKWLAQLGNVLAVGVISKGARFQLYTIYSGSRKRYLIADPGAAGATTPFLRLEGAALILDDTEPTDADSVIPNNQVGIWWDDTNLRLKHKDDGGVTYIPGFNDRGDPASYDWTEATLTLDGTWNDLDCSSIVPAGAKAIMLSVHVEDNLKGVGIAFRKNGNTNAIAHQECITGIANSENHESLIIGCDSGRIIEYSAPAGVDSIDIVVTGWFI